MTYQLQNGKNGQPAAVLKDELTSIPFAPDNTDYQQFKADLANGTELQDADGKPMTADQIKTFLEGLA